MKFAKATNFNRKSGEAEESAVSASQYRMLTGETVLFIGSISTRLRQVEGTMNIAKVDYGEGKCQKMNCHPDRSEALASAVEGPAVYSNSNQVDRKTPANP